MRLAFFALLCIFVLILASAPQVFAAENSQAPQAPKALRYVCPMHPDQASDKPGSCPLCGMAMVEREKAPVIRNVAILVFDGVQIIDYAGPYEVFGQQHWNVYTVASKPGPITTAMGMSVNPAYTFANAPKPNILLVPGGDVKLEDRAILDWIVQTSKQTDYVLSICNGAFYLAKAGLLDGLSATTFHGMINDLRTTAPKTKVVTDQRYVDNGKIITSAGLSSGIDASLYLISKIEGMERAREVALHMEYDWHPESNYARANMADKYLVDLDLPQAQNWHTLRNIGSMNDWEYKGTLQINMSAEDLLKEVNRKIAASKKWTLVSSDATHSNWKLKDERGQTWTSVVTVEAVAGEAGTYGLGCKVQRETTKTTAVVQ
jgi:putative intracellular protease/amidase